VAVFGESVFNAVLDVIRGYLVRFRKKSVDDEEGMTGKESNKKSNKEGSDRTESVFNAMLDVIRGYLVRFRNKSGVDEEGKTDKEGDKESNKEVEKRVEMSTVQNPMQTQKTRVMNDVIGVPLPPSDWAGYVNPNYKAQRDREQRIFKHFRGADFKEKDEKFEAGKHVKAVKVEGDGSKQSQPATLEDKLKTQGTAYDESVKELARLQAELDRLMKKLQSNPEPPDYVKIADLATKMGHERYFIDKFKPADASE
jgi:hypothetical protein